MNIETISSAQNPRIKHLLALQQKSSLRREEGLFVVEGRRELEHCIHAGMQVECIFCLDETKTTELSKLSTDSKLYTLSSKLNEIDVYLIIALFIVKHEVQFRQQAKAWCQSHPDCPLVIRRFLSIAKQIRC